MTGGCSSSYRGPHAEVVVDSREVAVDGGEGQDRCAHQQLARQACDRLAVILQVQVRRHVGCELAVAVAWWKAVVAVVRCAVVLLLGWGGYWQVEDGPWRKVRIVAMSAKDERPDETGEGFDLGDRFLGNRS